eukprot:GHRR01018780.1.p1 GENE.GHRR01018780.1~~GHRR01018780.1.p1  ORF type:complete len:574 (+),score=155.68 GHRR01018780.1:228-1949(+)
MQRTQTYKGSQAPLLPPTGLPIWPDEPSTDQASAMSRWQQKPKHANQPWRYKQRRLVIGANGEHYHSIGYLLSRFIAVWSALLLLFLAWWKPNVGLTSVATTSGLLFGLLYSWMYYHNKKHKQQLQQVLSMDPGLKGCQYLLGTLPTWINLTEREKMEWLNRMLSEMWPYYDRGICTMIKDTLEPIMDQYRPPVFKRIMFQELTFGEAPFRVEGITVKDEADEIDLEVDVRWSGDANISLGFEPAVGGEYTRITPKVKDIVFVATLKIVLKPLVDTIPGFAAAALALKGDPIIKYRLDFGVLPSAVTAVVTAPVRFFVDKIIDMIVSWFLWPNRFPVPILSWNGWLPANDPSIDLEVERMSGRQQGVIKVHIIQAKELNNYDTIGKSDPFVEVFITPDHRYATKVISNNLNPQWHETKYLPVIEKDQVLRLEVFDHDTINIKESLPLLGSGKGGSQEFMGRAAVPLAPFIAEAGQEDESWVPLGRGDWTGLGGPGQGEGWLKLGLQYRPVADIASGEIQAASIGLLFVGVIRCHNLVSDRGDKMASYVQVRSPASVYTNILLAAACADAAPGL